MEDFRLRTTLCLAWLILIISPVCAVSSTPWSGGIFSDSDRGFQISVPRDWNLQEMNNQDSFTSLLTSPDENVAVAITTYPGAASAGLRAALDNFQQTALSSTQPLAEQTGSLNGRDGLLRAYRIHDPNGPVITGAFALAGNGSTYVVWSMIPEAMYDARFAEADALMNTFNLTGGFSQHAPRSEPGHAAPATPPDRQRTVTPVDGYHWFTEETSGLRWQTPKTWGVEKIGANPTILPSAGDRLADAGGIKVQNVDRNTARFKDLDHAVADVMNFISTQKGTLLNRERKNIAGIDLHITEFTVELGGESHHMWFIHVERPALITVIQYDAYGTVHDRRFLAEEMRQHVDVGLGSLREIGK